MARSPKEMPAPSPAPVQAPTRIEVSNRWNQILTVPLRDGSEIHIHGKGTVTIDEGAVSDHMTQLQRKGIVRLRAVA